MPELHFNVADWLLPTANAEGVLPQLEKISRLPGFNGPPLSAEQRPGTACGAQSGAQCALDSTAGR